jgi:hypothetical protein
MGDEARGHIPLERKSNSSHVPEMASYSSDEEIISTAIPTRLDVDAILAYFEAQGESPQDMSNRIALTVARRFDDNEMSFDDANAVIYELWRFMIAYVHPRPGEGLWQPTFELYEAFDRGEYDQGESVDPVERYTRPWVKEILQRY